ncbi:MAG: kynureninase [Solirubrobacteraceae bacterium]
MAGTEPTTRGADGDRADPLSRAAAEAADAADPLAAYRDRFVHGDDRIYLDGNSLGRLPVATRERLAALTADWGERLVSGWPEWIDAPTRAGDLLAGLIGAAPGEVVACDSTTVNLFKLVGAALDARGGGAVVTDRGNFPTDRYVLEGIAAQRGLDLRLFDGEPDPARLRCAPGDVVVLSQVAYRTGALADLPALQAAARERGATLIWDLSHSAGAVPVDLGAAGAELAVGCTYKYLNAGPGAPAYLYVATGLQAQLRSPIWGWFGQREQFAMERPYDPEPSIRRFLAGTPPILGLAAVEEGARLTAQAGIGALHAKAIDLTELIVALHDAWLAPLGFALASPRDPARGGSHVSLRHADTWRITRALVERADVIPDFRGPDSVRLGVAPLYTRHADVWDAMDRLRGLVERGEHTSVDSRPGRVT